MSLNPLQGIAAGLIIGLAVGVSGAWYVQGLRSDKAVAKLTESFEAQKNKAREDGIAEGKRKQTLANDVAAQGRKDDVEIEKRGAAAATAAGGLQHDAAVYASASSCDPGIARRGEAATRAAGVLSDLLGQCGTAYTGMARIADQARARGLRCEQIMDGLNPTGSN